MVFDLPPVALPGAAQTARCMSFEGANFPAPAIPLLEIRTRVGMISKVDRLGGWRGFRYYAWLYSYDRRSSHPYNAGTEHVGLSPTRQTLLAPSVKHIDEVFGESHER